MKDGCMESSVNKNHWTHDLEWVSGGKGLLRCKKCGYENDVLVKDKNVPTLREMLFGRRK